MKLRRHKQFLKDWNKTKLTDGQFTKFIQFSECLRLNKPLPPESRDHDLNGELGDNYLGRSVEMTVIAGMRHSVFMSKKPDLI